MEQILLVAFTFGFTIFFSLSMVEAPVWGTIFRPKTAADNAQELRFTHRALQKLTSKLPASNGLVILRVTGIMVMQILNSPNDTYLIFQFATYWTLLLFIILVLKNPKTVKDIRSRVSAADDIGEIRNDIRRVGRDHHVGLIANLFGIISQLFVIWS